MTTGPLMGQVTVDHAAGRACIGDTVLDVEPIGTTGTLRFAGTVVRPLTFGERVRLVDEALAHADPVAALLALVGQAAGGTALGPAGIAIALHLAGAGSGAPGFATTLAEVTTATGWGADEVLDRRAIEVDALARGLQRDGRHPGLGAAAIGNRDLDAGGWRRFVAADGPTAGPTVPTTPGETTAGDPAAGAASDARAPTPAGVARRLAQDLLSRGREPIAPAAGLAAIAAEVRGTRPSATSGHPPAAPASPRSPGDRAGRPNDPAPPADAGRPRSSLGAPDGTSHTPRPGPARPVTGMPTPDDDGRAAVSAPGPDHDGGVPASPSALPPTTSTPLAPTDRAPTDREPVAPTHDPLHSVPPHAASPGAGSGVAPGTPPAPAAAPLARPAHARHVPPGGGSPARDSAPPAVAPPAAQRPGARHGPGGTSRTGRPAAPAPPHVPPDRPEAGTPPSTGRPSGPSGAPDVAALALGLAIELDREADLRGVLP